MKKVILSSFFIAASFLGFTQEEISPAQLQKIKSEIELQIPALKKQLATKDLSKDEVELSIDTFRIERLNAKRIEIDYSTAGMVTATEEKTAAYDKLMNKYYGLLAKSLKPEDKKTLLAAQKAWLAYRDAEQKLIGTMTKDEYSGGGTIQMNIASQAYSSLVIDRTWDIINYYLNNVNKD